MLPSVNESLPPLEKVWLFKNKKNKQLGLRAMYSEIQDPVLAGYTNSNLYLKLRKHHWLHRSRDQRMQLYLVGYRKHSGFPKNCQYYGCADS